MNLIKFAAIVTSIIAATGVVQAAQTQTSQSRRLIGGDYKFMSRGQIRRLLVLSDKKIAYDIWRATPSGLLEHLHFTLVSPSDTPNESSRYTVTQSEQDCGQMTLRMYHRNGQVFTHPSIILATYGSTTQPFGSFDESASLPILEKDAAMVAQISKDAKTSEFYDSLTAILRDYLTAGIPICNNAKPRAP